MLVVAMLSILSCEHHKETYGYTEVTFTYTCSEDLLNFFTPTIIVGGFDSTKILSLDRTRFIPTGKEISVIFLQSEGNDTIQMPEYAYSFTKKLIGKKGTIILDDFLEPNKGNWHLDKINNYALYHGFSDIQYEFYCPDGHSLGMKERPIPLVGYRDINSSKDTLNFLAHLLMSWDVYSVVDIPYTIEYHDNTINSNFTQNVSYNNVGNLKKLIENIKQNKSNINTSSLPVQSRLIDSITKDATYKPDLNMLNQYFGN